MKKILICALAVLCAASVASAAMPLQLGIGGETLQLCKKTTPVTGLKLNVPYADSDEAAGLDIGFVGGAGEFTGLRLNAVNLSRDCSTGLEVGVLNIAYNEYCDVTVKKNGVVEQDGELVQVTNHPVNNGDPLYEGDVLTVTATLREGVVPVNEDMIFSAAAGLSNPYNFTYTYTDTDVGSYTTYTRNYTVTSSISLEGTTLLLEVVRAQAPAFAPAWQRVNAPMLGGHYLLPQTLAAQDLQWLAQSD